MSLQSKHSAPRCPWNFTRNTQERPRFLTLAFGNVFSSHFQSGRLHTRRNLPSAPSTKRATFPSTEADANLPQPPQNRRERSLAALWEYREKAPSTPEHSSRPRHPRNQGGSSGNTGLCRLLRVRCHRSQLRAKRGCGGRIKQSHRKQTVTKEQSQLNPNRTNPGAAPAQAREEQRRQVQPERSQQMV